MFISHDLSMVRHISRRVAVMHKGRLLEIGDANALFDAPRHEYSRQLLATIPADTPRQRRGRDLRNFAAVDASATNANPESSK